MDRFAVDLRHQWAGGVDGEQMSLGRLSANRRRHAVGRIKQGHALGNFRQIVDEDHPPLPELLDNPGVVHDFVVGVQRRAVGFDGQRQGLDGHIDAGTEPPRCGQN